MHESELENQAHCAACGAEVSLADRVYAFGADELLCFNCALERRGVYEEDEDRWTAAPHVDDLLERSAAEFRRGA